MIDRLSPNRFRPAVLGLVSLLCLPIMVIGASAPAEAQAQPRTEEAASASVMTGFTQKATGTTFEARLAFAGKPRATLVLLRRPDRVAIDLLDTVSAMEDIVLEPNALVSELRQGLVASDRFRIILTLKRPGVPKAEISTKDGKATLSLSIESSTAQAFEAVAARQAIGEGDEGQGRDIADATIVAPERTFVVVVDPGHGGVDTGAVGKEGTMEKDVNLAFARSLRDALKKDSHIDVRLTRDDDRFISLSERSDIARKAKADIFISMHADSIRYSDIRGATVYTLSDRASDQLAREIAENENSSDRFVDPEWQKSEPEVFDILIELMRRETDSFSKHFAAGLVQELGRHKIRLIRNPQRSAGFRVLTAPDVPSVLVELGYLSNVDDEELLLDESWREDTASAIAAAVVGFLGTEAPAPDVGAPLGGG